MGSGPRARWGPAGAWAIQLGLRGDVLARYARGWLLGVEDVSDFVAEQRANAAPPYGRLVTPGEDVYPVADPEVAGRLGLSNPDGDEREG